jgi:hypothetical protein
MTQAALFNPTIGRPAVAVAGPTHTEVHMELTTVALPGGRCLRLAAMDGMLLLGDGFEAGDPLRALVQGMAIPAELWPAVRQELDRLAGT